MLMVLQGRRTMVLDLSPGSFSVNLAESLASSHSPVTSRQIGLFFFNPMWTSHLPRVYRTTNRWSRDHLLLSPGRTRGLTIDA